VAGKRAWISGLRRVETPARANVPIVHVDVRTGLVKINPLARWTDDDVTQYKCEHRLIEHPLAAQGYSSIGCWPCTSPITSDAHPRSGRWPGAAKTECGLHDFPRDIPA